MTMVVHIFLDPIQRSPVTFLYDASLTYSHSRGFFLYLFFRFWHTRETLLWSLKTGRGLFDFKICQAAGLLIFVQFSSSSPFFFWFIRKSKNIVVFIKSHMMCYDVCYLPRIMRFGWFCSFGETEWSIQYFCERAWRWKYRNRTVVLLVCIRSMNNSIAFYPFWLCGPRAVRGILVLVGFWISKGNRPSHGFPYVTVPCTKKNRDKSLLHKFDLSALLSLSLSREFVLFLILSQRELTPEWSAARQNANKPSRSPLTLDCILLHQALAFTPFDASILLRVQIEEKYAHSIVRAHAPFLDSVFILAPKKLSTLLAWAGCSRREHRMRSSKTRDGKELKK